MFSILLRVVKLYITIIYLLYLWKMKRTGPTTRAQSKNMPKNEYEKLKNVDDDDIEFQNIRQDNDENETKKNLPKVKTVGVNNKKRTIRKTKQSDSDVTHQLSSTSDLSDNEDRDELIKSKSSEQQHLQQNIKKDLKNIALLMFLYFLQGINYNNFLF